MWRNRKAIGVFNQRCVMETLRGQPTLSSSDLSSSVLFFVTDSSMNTVKEDSEYVGLRSIQGQVKVVA